MFNLKWAYGIFFLAALLFVAKPFIGFKLYHTLNDRQSTGLLVAKVFAKRKPEDLREAEKRKAAIARQISHPPVKVLTTLLSVIGLFFLTQVTYRFNRLYLRAKLNYSPLIYILTGKLVI